MAYSSEAERYRVLDDVAEIIAAYEGKPIEPEALALTIAQRVFPSQHDYQKKWGLKFVNKCLSKNQTEEV
jgi:hypothetical protein